ncbi:2-phosphosulfolactate phosphatase [Saccharothrix coeruleofusca]|uniref:2-phosphosulfolactate phosphatase n=1 Tax=Saccharothrix coeruleofusca TaxID=33919 RepID=UPI001AEAFAE7|nr:2-phosphosulfolactate phosphatase [Saccharothrix coeruleofusca]MBP2334152.1 2-phosphosulfolactate phosphatase [Saccharothrix coeruleofusca]
MFGQQGSRVRLEWGGEGVAALGEQCAVLVVVDVLSFSTAVDVAVGRGAEVRPVTWSDRAAVPPSRWNLRPSSLVDVPAGAVVELPSPNGATLCGLAAGTGATVLVGCLRNAEAVARAAGAIAGDRPIGVVPAGERWGVGIAADASGGPLRPSAEDLLGAGAVVASLREHGPLSVEADLAAGVFERAAVAEFLAGCVSGRELAAAGHAADVALAGEVGASRAVPVLADGVLTDLAR